MTENKMTVEQEKKVACAAMALAIGMAAEVGSRGDRAAVREISGACENLVSGLIDDREAARGALTERQTEILRLADEIREARTAAATVVDDFKSLHAAMDLSKLEAALDAFESVTWQEGGTMGWRTS